MKHPTKPLRLFGAILLALLFSSSVMAIEFTVDKTVISSVGSCKLEIRLQYQMFLN